MKRLLFILVIVLSCITRTHTQTIYRSDGYVNALHPGVTYTLLPVAKGDTLVEPYSEWDGWWAVPMVFTISALPYEEFLVAFSIAGNVNACGESISASFAGDALWWEEAGRYLDPRNPQLITVDSSGKVTLNLGITLTLPPGAESSLFDILVYCRVVELSTGDTVVSSAMCGAEQDRGNPFFGTELEVRNLRRGQTYTIHPGPDTLFITPVNAGGEIGDMEPIRIEGVAGADVLISFILPRVFPNDDELGSLPCRFDTNAVYIEEGSQWLDPNTGPRARIGPRCVSHLRMGVTLDVPVDAVPGWYTGQIIASVTYVQGPGASPIPFRQSEKEILIHVQVLGEELPEDYSLSQNYPNPFNSTTTISYGLPQESAVVLEVYDPLGRKIRTLVDGVRGAGIHKEHFDARDLPSGVYVYRLTAGSFRDMRKLILIR